MRALFAVAAIVLLNGCDGNSSKPAKTAKPIDDGGPAEKTIPVPGVKPAASTADAKLAILRLLHAHTERKPEALAAFRNCVIKRKGEMNQGGDMIPAECVDRFAWPGRYRGEWKLGSLPPFTLFADRGAVMFFAPSLGHAKPEAKDAAETANVLEDLRATWMTTLVPLTDDATAEMVADAPKETPAIRVWVGDQPPLVMVLDEKTGLLAKVLFEKAGDIKRETWSFVLADFKPVKGVMLPHKVVYTAGRQAGATWTAVDYETVSGFPAGTFEKP